MKQIRCALELEILEKSKLFPVKVSERIKLGAFVPKASIVEGVATMLIVLS